MNGAGDTAGNQIIPNEALRPIRRPGVADHPATDVGNDRSQAALNACRLVLHDHVETKGAAHAHTNVMDGTPCGVNGLFAVMMVMMVVMHVARLVAAVLCLSRALQVLMRVAATLGFGALWLRAFALLAGAAFFSLRFVWLACHSCVLPQEDAAILGTAAPGRSGPIPDPCRALLAERRRFIGDLCEEGKSPAAATRRARRGGCDDRPTLSLILGFRPGSWRIEYPAPAERHHVLLQEPQYV